jgi:anti-anti-sigma factor
MTAFRLTAHEAGPARDRVVEVHGDLGLPDVDRLQQALEDPAFERRGIVVGLEGCEFIDSMALAALLRSRDRLAADGRRLVIAAATGQVRRVLSVSGLDIDGFFFDTVEQALSKG